ncbi:PAS domain S-box protein, partial [Leptospira sp. SA-E8]|uniref:PAS domain S-box protein n=1 Tax=Leptospira sp. SA-E8 TaxID=3422259 RepID=UPI003EBE6026
LLIRLWHRGEAVRALAREAKLARHHQMLFRHTGDAIFTLREDGHIIDANEAAARMYGYALAQFPGMHIRELRPPEGRAAQAAQRAQDKIGQSRTFLAEHQRADGSRFMAEVTASTSELDGKRLQHSVVRDVTARQRIETQLRVAASFFERSNAAVLIADGEGRVQTVNPAYTRLTGFGTEDLVGRTWAGLQESLTQADASAKRNGHEALQVRQFWEGELPLMRKNGQSYPARVILNGYLDKRGRIEQYVMVHTDLSIIRNAQSQLQYAATRDLLTGLSNRAQLEQQLEIQVQQAELGAPPFVFVMLNLDHWRSINDSIGYSTADQLLHLVAERLSLLVPGPEAVFRFG